MKIKYSITDLVRKNDCNTEAIENENAIPGITDLIIKFYYSKNIAEVENADITGLVKNTGFNTKLGIITNSVTLNKTRRMVAQKKLSLIFFLTES